MTKAAINNAVTRIKTDSMRADQPVDTSRMFYLVDGIAHMVDTSHKYRVHWINDSPFAVLASNISPLVYNFPCTVTQWGKWPNFDVRVATTSYATGGSEDFVIRASIITPGTSLLVRGLTSGVLGTATVTNPVTQGWNIDELFTDIDSNRCPMQVTPAGRFSGDTSMIGYNVMLQLVIEFPGLFSEGGGAGIIGVQCREYPS